MPVAKTYAKMSLIGEPFQENGRMYIYVAAPKGQKKVRWYSEAEYRRMYPDVVLTQTNVTFNARHAFGFDEGYITLYKGHNVKTWAEEDRTNIWYNLIFGYYTPGKFDLPTMKEDITPIQLKWEEIMDHDNIMKPYEEVQKIVSSLINDESTSVYQGEINDWLEKKVTIRENTTREDHFGEKHTHYMVDSENNTYLWETGAKNIACNETVYLKMKVKEHKEINGEKVTVVWYCKEI